MGQRTLFQGPFKPCYHHKYICIFFLFFFKFILFGYCLTPCILTTIIETEIQNLNKIYVYIYIYMYVCVYIQTFCTIVVARPLKPILALSSNAFNLKMFPKPKDCNLTWSFQLFHPTNTFLHNRLFHLYAKANRLEDACNLFDQMPKERCHLMEHNMLLLEKCPRKAVSLTLKTMINNVY